MLERLPVGRVHGHRGLGGELTVRVSAGDAERWAGVSSVWLQRGDAVAERFDVEGERSYRDRWVLKLRGFEDATQAAAWRGATVSVDKEAAPELGEYEYWRSSLIGMRVLTKDGAIGQVSGVQPTGGIDLLIVKRSNDDEVMIPMHREIVVDIDQDAGCLTIEPPDGLLELNEIELKEDKIAP